MTNDRRVTLELSEQELVDLGVALDNRLRVIDDARSGFRCQMGGLMNQAAERVSYLQARIDVALKQLRKMPGGGR